MKNHRLMMQSITSFLFITLIVLIACDDKSKEDISQDPSEQINKEESIDGEEFDSLRALVLGQFDPSQHTSFVLIDQRHADRGGLYLQKDAYDAFKKMSAAAELEGIKMIIRSATRNFDYQRGIWERKWNGQTPLESGLKATDIADPKARALRILLYSSMPGTSRHHWGTDIDLNAFENNYFESGEGLKLYEWMQAHAAEFGFCQPYTDKSDGRTGYEEEKWHWSYFPLSRRLTHFADEYMADSLISGFEGAETATEIMVVKNYVLGIDSSCLSE